MHCRLPARCPGIRDSRQEWNFRRDNPIWAEETCHHWEAQARDKRLDPAGEWRRTTSRNPGQFHPQYLRSKLVPPRHRYPASTGASKTSQPTPDLAWSQKRIWIARGSHAACCRFALGSRPASAQLRLNGARSGAVELRRFRPAKSL